VGQEFLDFHQPHILWMPFVVKKYITLYPGDIAFLRPETVMLEPHEIPDLIQQFPWPA